MQFHQSSNKHIYTVFFLFSIQFILNIVDYTVQLSSPSSSLEWLSIAVGRPSSCAGSRSQNGLWMKAYDDVRCWNNSTNLKYTFKIWKDFWNGGESGGGIH